MRERGPKPSCHVSGGTEPGFTLNHLKHDDYHEICGLTERVRNIIPDEIDPPWWDSRIPVGAKVITPDGKGQVSGYAVDTETEEVTEFARVNGRLYHVSVLKRA